MIKRLLIAYAHPDDESFGLGSTIAKYHADGVEITLICATNGDVGTVAPERLAGYESIAALRLAELNCAAEVLGFKEVITIGYRDSGMMDSADNADPRSLWQAPLAEVTDRIVEVMRRAKPQVVITFDPYGAYGHPDHIKIHRATLAAFEQVRADGSDVPQKLYYMALPRTLLRFGVNLIRLTGRDPRRMGTNKDMDFAAVAEAALPFHACINVADYYEIGRRAAACHASQSSPDSTIPGARFVMRRFAATASFTRAFPIAVDGEPLERDLFAGTT